MAVFNQNTTGHRKNATDSSDSLFPFLTVPQVPDRYTDLQLSIKDVIQPISPFQQSRPHSRLPITIKSESTCANHEPLAAGVIRSPYWERAEFRVKTRLVACYATLNFIKHANV